MSLNLTRMASAQQSIELLAESLAARGGGRISVLALAANTSRRGRRSWAPGIAARSTWTWDRADRGDRTWFPQGIAHSWHTGYGDSLLVTTWYSTSGEGSRVSFFNLDTGRYHHALLVQLGRDGVERLKIHAGGVVWQGDHLHIAATRRGFFSFDLRDLMHDPAREYGYDYLLPAHSGYRPEPDQDSAPIRFSFLSLDRSAEPPALLVGEYSRSGAPRLAHYAFDEVAGRGELIASCTGVQQMQGAVLVAGTYYLTVSRGPFLPGEVVVGRPGGWHRLRGRTPPGPEDLAFHPPTDRFWSLSEHPHRRWIFSMPRRALRP